MVDELKRLRERAGIVEEFDTNFAMHAGAGMAAPPTNAPNAAPQGSGLMQSLMQLAQSGDRFADEMLETLKVAHNMTPQEAVERIAHGYLRMKGVVR